MSLKNFQSCPQQIIAATRHFNGSHVYEEESFESSKSEYRISSINVRGYYSFLSIKGAATI